MKTSKTLLLSAFLLGTATLAYAGPGPQYWQQRRNPPARQTKQVVAHDESRTAKTPEPAKPAKCCAECPSCAA
ncbi:MAG TPA: hypothetical protein VK163_12080 [Opitutaceae bacterium]|nr:hypothetical protein [Opitutaceae bacterium]